MGGDSGDTVYKVLHKLTRRLYALKIEILRDVDNPNVVKCHDMYDHIGEIQVLLEHMDDGSLEETHIVDELALSDIAIQILFGLHYLNR
eukprot:XP_019081946.1 PREDICTED: mitogen-activated protein kinase kinase 5-like [Vitis vinifera]